jgi:hypothetical protein
MKKRVLLLTTSALVLGCGAITASAQQSPNSPLMLPESPLMLPPAQPQTTQQR